MIKRSLWILALTAALAACSSGVKLSEVPVEDKNASASAPASTDAAQSSVAPVVGGKAGAQGVAPAGVNVVYFDYDSFALKPEARAVLERNAAHLHSNKQFKVQLEAVSFGKEKPAASGADEATYAKNRRVEIKY